MSFPSWLRSLQFAGKCPRPARRQKQPACRPQLEALEDRTTPSLFGVQTPYATGGIRPLFVAVGDFNRDGNPDLVTANNQEDSVSVLLGNGAGGFATAVTFTTGLNPSSVAVGDFNRDGKDDLAVANFGSDNVSVLLGDGAGGFAAPTNLPVGSSPRSMAVADFNRDGNPDVVVTNFGSNSVSVLLGNGLGGFGAAKAFATDLLPIAVAVGDFNRDGSPDLAVANFLSSPANVSVLLGNGTGGFAVAANFATGGFEPTSVAAGDFNRDGKPDLAVANINDNVSVLLGDGIGGFAIPTLFTVGHQPESVVVGDFNRDGKDDLAVANAADRSVSVLLGTGLGTFQAALNLAAGAVPFSLAVGDFNNDRAPDLAVTNVNDDSVSVLLGQATLTDTIIAAAPSVYGQPLGIVALVSKVVPSAAGIPSGTVIFKEGETTLGTATLDDHGDVGQAFIWASTLAAGYHHITAVYQGDPVFQGSTSLDWIQLVTQDDTLTTISTSSNPGLTGQPITFTATVTSQIPGSGFPTGTVLFTDDTDTGMAILGSMTLSGGTATFTTASLSPSLTPITHIVHAIYLGDDNFKFSASELLVQVVKNPTPIMTNLSVASLPEGSLVFTLTIAGTNFLVGASTVQWNGVPLTIVSASSTQLQVTVPAALLLAVGTSKVTVANPGPGGGTSLPQTFTIMDAPLTASGVNLSVTGNKNFSGVVATFTDGNPNATLADFKAIITWDDGTAAYGTITGGGPFTVSGSHKFAGFANLHAITVTILDKGGSSATVTDNIIDPPALTPNQLFVAHLYQDLLQRDPDAAGLAHWSGLLDRGVSRSQVAARIIASRAYQNVQVQRLYQSYLHHDAGARGLAHFTAILQAGGALETVQAQILGSAEYYRTRAGGSAAGFLNALYADVLHRALDDKGRTIYGHALAHGATRAQVAATLLRSRESRQSLVQTAYQTMLHRAPRPGELSRLVSALERGAGDTAVRAVIVSSREYWEN